MHWVDKFFHCRRSFLCYYFYFWPMEVSTQPPIHPGIYLWGHYHLMMFILGANQMGIFFSFLLGHSTLVREIFHIICTDAFLVFQAHSSGHILMGVILPRILFKCRSYSALGSPLSLHPTSFLPPPSERPSLPKQRLPQQEPTLALLLYPASPRAALSQVAPISRSLPTVYQLTTQHSLLRS